MAPGKSRPAIPTGSKRSRAAGAVAAVFAA